ncbi:MAG: TonB-dependent siderophore receptor, partial [Parahaliea sp.]
MRVADASPGRLNLLVHAVALATLPLCHGALAQESGNAASGALEEVIVTGRYTVNDRLDTATGLGLSLQETPQSVSILTFQRIEDQNLDSLTDAVMNAPGTSAKEGDSSRYFFSSRGFSIDNYQIDGVPMLWQGGGDAGETQTNLMIFERVEVVRGATGLLTGVGEPSASLNLVHKTASSTELFGRVSASTGRWDTYGVSADVGSRLNASGSIRGRAIVKYQQGESHTDLLESETSVYYGTVDADLTDTTLLRLGASYQDNDPTASTWGGLPSWYADGSRSDWSRSKTIGADWTRWASTNKNYFVHLIQQLSASWEAKFYVNVAKNDAELNLLYLYGHPDRNTGLGMGGSPYNARTERHQTVAGVQLAGDYSLFGRQHELVAGFQYSRQDF